MKRFLSVLLALSLLLPLGGCAASETREGLGNGWESTGSLKLDYATQFQVDYYDGGCKLISIADGSRFLVVPENAEVPKGIARDIVPLHQPIRNIYLAATSAMCLIDALGGLDAISLSGVRADAWYVENARIAMEEGRLRFAGKYSEPDYELILSQGCPLAVESLMIGHASDVKDKLEELGIAVLVDHSGKESHPLGRSEWIKLYGVLLNKEKEAEALFEEQKAFLSEAKAEATGKTAAFFYLSASGFAVVRKSGDYVSKMIELAGGQYIFDDIGDAESGTSTVTVEMETFFAAAKEADTIIYNSTVEGEIETLDELLEKNELLREFRAVKNNNVWCTEQNMHQETLRLGEMIRSFQMIFSGEADELDELPFLHRLR